MHWLALSPRSKNVWIKTCWSLLYGRSAWVSWDALVSLHSLKTCSLGWLVTTLLSLCQPCDWLATCAAPPPMLYINEYSWWMDEINFYLASGVVTKELPLFSVYWLNVSFTHCHLGLNCHYLSFLFSQMCPVIKTWSDVLMCRQMSHVLHRDNVSQSLWNPGVSILSTDLPCSFFCQSTLTKSSLTPYTKIKYCTNVIQCAIHLP